jgi:glycosyltransferase involved in cell wall biosynthesis
MRILVYPHTMEIGGSQLNAIEIAAGIRDRGHYVAVVSRPGPLVETVQRLGLKHFPLDTRAHRIPSPHAAAHLIQLVRDHRIDIVHGYEWPPTIEAFAGPRLRLGLPVVSTIMSMAVAPFLPRTIPLIVGTDDIRRHAIAAGHSRVTLLEPPVDVGRNTPSHDPGPFRGSLGLDPSAPLLAIVCRVVPELKLEGLLSACDAVGELVHSGVKLQLVIVGDGSARPLVEQAATAANARAGRRVVVLTGQLADPRPAYAAADVVLGMGGSAVRGLAFGKPLIVQGEHGFWELLTPDSAPRFLRQGWYGLGTGSDGRSVGAAQLAKILRELLDDHDARARLGDYGRRLVVERFSIDRASAIQEELYAAAMRTSGRRPAMPLATDAARTAVGIFRYKIVRRWQRWRGTAATDDFSATVKVAVVKR